MSYMKNPMGIEEKSFQIIDSVIRDSGRHYPTDDLLSQYIYKRVIHTSADFDYLDNLKIHPDFISRFKAALDAPLTIYTDTNMVKAGINKRALALTPWSLKCFVADDLTAKIAKEEGITRSMAAIKLALDEPGPKLFVVGNAPTAIFKLLEYDQAIKDHWLGIIGVPVGFVGAAESKEALYHSDIPYITALGRKGGSNVAAAIINALVYQLKGRQL